MRNFSFSNIHSLCSAWLLGCLLLISCNDAGERDNPMDPGSSKYSSQAESMSSAGGNSSGALSSEGGTTASSGSSVSSSSDATCANTYGTNTVTDCRDNHTYKTVVIGEQTWLAENLAYLPSVNVKEDKSIMVAQYYVYGYDDTSVSEARASSNYTTYGVLYNWPAAMAACPSGWHLPSSDEWTTLETSLGGDSTAGTRLKSVSGWTAGADTGMDTYGFSALPGGYYNGAGFYHALYYGYWWTATEFSSTGAYKRYMYYSGAYVYSDNNSKDDGFSVRCLQDQD